jgi:putative solute:sodium symporter small subunit
MNLKNDYHISFFKPTTDRAKYNRNLALWLICIWALATFGFQFLLRAIEKPTPEPQLITFNEVWDNVKSGSANNDELTKFVHSTLHVTGKVFISPEHRGALDNGITWATFQLADSAQKLAIAEALVEFDLATTEMNTITDENYVLAKLKLGALAQAVVGLAPNDVLVKILPLELKVSGMEVFTDANKAVVEECMPFYTIHNRSVLTDTKFLGFPFHYFYTAVFLLILFIGLCLLYCYRIDVYNKKNGLAD